jgi:peptidoglycan/LPS O-acetylase OafA/YrhL
MPLSKLVARLRTSDIDCRFCAGAAVVFLVAVAAIAYGLTEQDMVTALGALLLVPAAGLLAAIGLSRDSEGEHGRTL